MAIRDKDINPKTEREVNLLRMILSAVIGKKTRLEDIITMEEFMTLWNPKEKSGEMTKVMRLLMTAVLEFGSLCEACLLYTSPSPRD